MKEDNINKLIEKYKSGETTLEEERALFKRESQSDRPLTKWFDYINRNNNTVPDNLNEKLWDSFQNRKKNHTNWIVASLAVAATLLIIVTLAINSSKKKEMDYAQKQALLEEARNMFKENTAKILYEDELIQIYTISE